MEQEFSLEDALALATIMVQSGNLEGAEGLYRQILAPVVPVLHALGTLGSTRGDAQAALLFLSAAAWLEPDVLPFRISQGRACFRTGGHVDARKAAEAALRLDPNSAEAHDLLAAVCLVEGKSTEAIASYEQATRLDPSMPTAWANLGLAYLLEGRFTEAAATLRRAVEARPEDSISWTNLVSVLYDLGLAQEAREAGRHAIESADDPDRIQSTLLFYTNVDAEMSPDAIAEAHKAWGRRLVARVRPAAPPREPSPDPSRRLRIGYVSPDLRQHPVAAFFAPVLANHDAQAVEVVCYDAGPREDQTSTALRALRPGLAWTSVTRLSDEALEARIRADGIDILVDLAGHTALSRVAAFVRTPAPIQVSYLGYPNTTGLPTMDYFVTDFWVDPPGETERWFSEELVRPFPSYLSYRAPAAPPVAPPPSASNGVLTFGSFASHWKLHEDVVDLWSAVLRAVPASRLLLKSKILVDAPLRDRFLGLFASRGIEASRLVLASHEPDHTAHMGKYAEMDICLDTWPYSGTVTTCETLWMGVPVVSLAAGARAGRVGASILNNVGLGDLVAKTPGEFARIAAELAGDGARLRELRDGLRERMEGSPLMDEVGFVRAFEESYRAMWRRWCQGPER